MFTINIYIYNQPSENFAKEDLELVVVLVCAWCTKLCLTLELHGMSMVYVVCQK